MVLKHLLSWWKSCDEWNYTPYSQVRPKVKYLLQGRVSGKESLTGWALQAFRYVTKMRICLEATWSEVMSSTCGGAWAYMTGGHRIMESWGLLSRSVANAYCSLQSYLLGLWGLNLTQPENRLPFMVPQCYRPETPAPRNGGRKARNTGSSLIMKFQDNLGYMRTSNQT